MTTIWKKDAVSPIPEYANELRRERAPDAIRTPGESCLTFRSWTLENLQPVQVRTLTDLIPGQDLTQIKHEYKFQIVFRLTMATSIGRKINYENRTNDILIESLSP